MEATPSQDPDPEQGDADHAVPADLVQLYETIEWDKAVKEAEAK